MSLSPIESGATFSSCRRYRFALWRVWDAQKPYLNVVGLNPSTADETRNDPTITRCMDRARRMGFGGYRMTNLFALRSTDPKGLRGDHGLDGPVGGDDNDEEIVRSALGAGMVVAAWGVHGALDGRGEEVVRMLGRAGVRLHCLGTTKDGHPKHPLYLRADVQPEPFWMAA